MNNNYLITLNISTIGTAGSGYPNIHLDIVADPERFYKVPTMTDPEDFITSNSLEEPHKKLTLALYARHNLTLCQVGTNYVDSLVQCSLASQSGGLACSVNKMRRTAVEATC
jgi:hypothetical protein